MKIKSIMARLSGLIILSAAGLAILSVLAAMFVRNSLMDAKVAETKALVETAINVVNNFHDRAQKGELDEATAKAMALLAVKSMRYDGGNYLVIYDHEVTSLMHPTRPDRDGKNFIDEKDASGQVYLREMRDKAFSGGGTTRYYYPRPGGDVPVEKLGYSLPYQPWNWFILTGLYIDDIDAEFKETMLKFFGISLVILLSIIAMALTVSRSISNPLRALVNITHRITSGDFQVEVPFQHRADEIGDLADAVQMLRDEAHSADNLRRQQQQNEQDGLLQRQKTMVDMANRFESGVMGLVNEVSTSAGHMYDVGEQMVSKVQDGTKQLVAMSSTTESATQNVETVSVAAGQLSSSIREISQQVSQAAVISTQASEEAVRANQLIINLSQTTDRIGEVVKLISDIASQTNLLALNATIEAARAGDAGKGFAVVASEVKNLANQTARATEEITNQIGAVQEETRVAVSAIGGIADIIEKVKGISSGIASAVEEQSAATDEIARNVQGAADDTQQISVHLEELVVDANIRLQLVNQVVASMSTMKGTSDSLRSEVKGFIDGIRRG